MTKPSLVVSHLTKRFGDVLAVDDLSFTAESGRVTGFMGPNGAGKTTTLRALLGLVTPTSGEATVLGGPYAALAKPMAKVGSHLDSSSFNPGMNGRQHLEAMAYASGAPAPKKTGARIEELLELVGLTSAANRRIGGYSLGMKQRLGLATALLGNPQILVLDEPANGLDPEGITWLRSFLRSFAAEGRTVLLSSHLLGEVQQIATDAVIINKGRLVASGTVKELEVQAGSLVYVASTNQKVLYRALAGANLEPLLPSGLPATPASDESPFGVRGATTAQVGQICFAAGVPLTHLSEQETGLETLFMNLVGEANLVGGAK